MFPAASRSTEIPSSSTGTRTPRGEISAETLPAASYATRERSAKTSCVSLATSSSLLSNATSVSIGNPSAPYAIVQPIGVVTSRVSGSSRRIIGWSYRNAAGVNNASSNTSSSIASAPTGIPANSGVRPNAWRNETHPASTFVSVPSAQSQQRPASASAFTFEETSTRTFSVAVPEATSTPQPETPPS